MHCAELQGREDKFRIVAACDTAGARRDRMAERYGCATYRRVADLIADENVELVDIATLSTDHTPHALLALRAGKDVFLEKPIAVSYGEARKLKTAEKRSRGRVYVRHNRRFEPAFQHIREIMASGILGEIHEIKLRRGSYQRRDDWQTLTRCGGGQLLNWGPHIIDHALRLLESPPADIWGDLKKIAAVGDAEDHLKVLLKGKNGRVVDLEISGAACIPEPEYIVSGSRGGLVCRGDEITMRYLNPRRRLSRRRPKSGSPPVEGGFGSAEVLPWVEKTIPVRPRDGCRMDDIWDHLYGAVREGKKFPITLDESIEVMRVVSAVKKGTPFEVR
jgi:predicted dehydrogenase